MYRLHNPSNRFLDVLSNIALEILDDYEKIGVSYEYMAVFYSRSSSYRFDFMPFYAPYDETALYSEHRSKAQLLDKCSEALALLALDGFEIVDRDGNIVTDEWEKEAI